MNNLVGNEIRVSFQSVGKKICRKESYRNNKLWLRDQVDNFIEYCPTKEDMLVCGILYESISFMACLLPLKFQLPPAASKDKGKKVGKQSFILLNHQQSPTALQHHISGHNGSKNLECEEGDAA